MLQVTEKGFMESSTRKFSARLAKKRKDKLVKTVSESSKQSNNCDIDEHTEIKDEIEKDNDSKLFLNCLELKPVVNISETAIYASVGEGQENLESDQENNKKPMCHCKNSPKPVSKTQRLKKKLKKIIKQKNKNLKKDTKIYVFQSNNDIENRDLSLESTAVTERLNNQTSTNEELCVEPEIKTDSNQLKSAACEEKSRESTHILLNSELKTEAAFQQVYIFRDVNKKVALKMQGSSGEDSSPNDLLAAVDLNRHGKKRRYDKLMKKLEDGEKTIESNLKEVKLLEDDDAEKEDIDQCVEKLKEKLRVREKKKYEYLINYMRDQWKVDQKSFQDLLPQKVEQVKANVVKQLGAHTEKVITEKRLRGRPRKIHVVGEEKKDSTIPKKAKVSQIKKKTNPTKKKSNAANRGFPVKFPKSLLPDANLAQNRQKFENFRLGIVDKDGGQKIIELNSDTVKSTQPLTSLWSSSDTNKIEGHKERSDQENCLLVKTTTDSPEITMQPNSTDTIRGSGDDGSKQPVPSKSNLKAPPTTITLPSISSLERDYELISLLPSSSPEIGDVKRDQFFIPQSTFHQDGKTSLIIVGPFCMVFEPKPRLVLVSPEQRKKGPTMILRRKIHSPSSTPPRDFRINKETRCFRPVEKMVADKNVEHGDPAVVLHDHDYMTPLELRDNVRRYCKAVAKHSANARFIDARVEDITEGEDNVVVTIKGDNMLRRVKNLANPSQAPMHCNEDGMPIVYNLSQIMTPALQRAEMMVKREEMVMKSRQTGDYNPVMFPLSAMGDVVMEVLIPPGGTELIPRTRSRNIQIVEEPSSHISLGMGDEVKENRLENQPFKFLHFNATINIDCDTIDVKEEIEINDVPSDSEANDYSVPIENEAAVDAGPRPGLPCCRVCLRLFPSDYVLFTHVRSHHSTCESRDTVYLEELRARSRLACPVCCDPPIYFATPPKLRRHLHLQHGIEHYVETCRFCHSEFLDKHELELHMDLSHNAHPRRSLVSLLTPHHQLIRGERSLLSCSRCNIVFSDRASLLSHTLKVHPELNQYNICRLCDKVFESGPALHKHLKKAHEQTLEGELKCPFCPAWLPNMELASVHRVTLHNGAVPVHCPFCGAGYQSLHPMYNHVRSQHLQTEAHICPECQSSFPSSRLLSEHARKVHLLAPHIMKNSLHSANSTTYCCPFCSVSFMRTYDLAVHVINSHREHLLPAQCHMCMQSFVSDIVMKMHMSGAHGMEVHSGDDVAYIHRHYEDQDSVGVVLEDAEDGMYSNDEDDYSGRGHSRRLVRQHLIDQQDILETQEAGRYLQELEDREAETIVYLNERNQVVNTGEMFGNCSSMEDVQLLSETGEDFNLHGVDYLETLSNDSIAVGADVVADVTMDDMANGRGQGSRSQELLSIAGQFEIDGVLYQLAASHEAQSHLRRASDIIALDGTDMRVVGERITLDANDFAHLLRQQVQ
ncbi:uncharacterized protein LOC131946725 isoform X2 [Physella acuta]|uniref:uncharacterized protein LOC131946725 isoform X2 n=1 Tax=Physella acuta TaxID=109671 RepID=UPI0027DC20A8|nr:uncharacterized protein LOC131946725 isoform X2 [Physella acuta]